MSNEEFLPDADVVLDKLLKWAREWQLSGRLDLLAAAAAALDLDVAMRAGRMPERWMPRWCLACRRENVSEWTICATCIDQGWWAYCVDARHASGPHHTRDAALEEVDEFECLGRHYVAGPSQLVGSCPACRRKDVPLNSKTERGVVKWLCDVCA